VAEDTVAGTLARTTPLGSRATTEGAELPVTASTARPSTGVMVSLPAPPSRTEATSEPVATSTHDAGFPSAVPKTPLASTTSCPATGVSTAAVAVVTAASVESSMVTGAEVHVVAPPPEPAVVLVVPAPAPTVVVVLTGETGVKGTVITGSEPVPVDAAGEIVPDDAPAPFGTGSDDVGVGWPAPVVDVVPGAGVQPFSQVGAVSA
jgi:hypothetical protein